MMHKFFILFNLLCCISISSSHAQTVSLENVLATSLNDEKVVRDIEIEKFSKTLDYKLPAVKKLELRFGINGNNSPDSLDGSLRNEDYYSINLTTNKWKEMKLQKEIKPIQTNLYTKEKEMYQMQAIEERYLVLTNLFYSLETYKKKKELKDLLTKKNELLLQLLNEGITIKISDAVDMERDLVQVYDMLQDDENAIALYNDRIRQFFNSSGYLTVNFDNIISLKKVFENNKTLKQDTSIRHPSVVFKEAQYQFAKANYRLERIQNTNVLNSFQLGYNRPVYTSEILRKFKPDNTLTFRVGVTVPLAGNNNLNRNNANMQQYNAMLNWRSAQTIQYKTITLQESKLDNTIRQYKVLSEIYDQSVVSKLLENDKVMAQSTALEIIDLKIAKKKLEINLLNSANIVMQSYILLLENKGLLQYDLRHKYLLEN